MKSIIIIIFGFFVFSSFAIGSIIEDDYEFFKKNGVYKNFVTLIEKSNGLEIPDKEGGRTEYEIADINHDGYLDIISVGDHGSPYVNSDQHGIMVWKGDGGSYWDVSQFGNFGYGGCAIGDLNNDGYYDIAFGIHHNYSSGLGDTIIDAALGDGTGEYWTEWGSGLASNNEDWGMFATAFADFDIDGDLDLVSQSFGSGNGIQAYNNNFDGTWSHAWGISGGNVRYTIETCDFNGDGYSDFICSHQNYNSYYGNGDFGFTNADTGLPVGHIYAIDCGDMNNDGFDDLVVGLNDLGVRCYIYDNYQNKWISNSSGLPVSDDYPMVQFGDMNFDGNLDIITYHGTTGKIYLGDGNGNWNADASWNMGSPGEDSAMRVDGDIDFDGNEDIVIQASQGSWPSDVNVLRLFSPWDSPSSLDARIKKPNGGEVFRIGSIKDIRWLSKVPASHGQGTVDIKLSINGDSGPWTNIASNMPNNGRYQWLVNSEESFNCYIKIILNTGSGSTSVISSSSFYILGSSDVMRVDSGGPYFGEINNSIEFEGFVYGGVSPYSWSWNFGDGNTSSEQNPNHIYIVPDDYYVTLSVTDFNDNTATDSTWAYIDEENFPPENPNKPSGPNILDIDESGSYSTKTVDINNDLLQYRFDWDSEGNHEYSDWTNLIESNTSKSMQNSWDLSGTYIVKSQAKDEHGLESNWSEGLSVTIRGEYDPPDNPNKPIGPSNLLLNEQGIFSTVTNDPNNFNVSYRFDWDANGYHDYSSWTDFIEPNIEINMSHSWDKVGDYLIKAQAKNEHNETSSWSEGLLVEIIKPNNPPSNPIITGIISGKPGEIYDYVFYSEDPDNDDIFYHIQWEESQFPDIFGPYSSGLNVTINHSWTDEGAFVIRVMAEDIHGAESDWTELEINIPKFKIEFGTYCYFIFGRINLIKNRDDMIYKNHIDFNAKSVIIFDLLSLNIEQKYDFIADRDLGLKYNDFKGIIKNNYIFGFIK